MSHPISRQRKLPVPEIPRDKHFGKAFAFLSDPYRYISKRCQELNSDLFQTRAFLRSGICIAGPAMAELFYDESRFKRRGVAPRRFQKTLFGQGSVQGMDGPAHQHRKRMFMSLMTPERINHIGALSAQQWAAYADKWSKSDPVVLYDETCELLTKVACSWAEVPLNDTEISARSRELTAMFDYAGSIGPKHWWARIARRRAERWMIDVVQQVRSRKLIVSDDSAAYVIAMHRDLAGELLDPRVAAVELLNVLRPIVAVGVYLTFAGLALHNYPACRQHLEAGADDYPHKFAQEVRRFYPFFPAVGAVVRHDFEWNGYRFPKGIPLLRDLYGTNHDHRTWANPNDFQPERFRDWDGNPFNFIPHGGGDHYTNHRCPGEWIAIELLKVASKFLANNIRYDLPDQDLEIDFRRVPALPRSKFIIGNIRALAG
jgi:fatty-acid peroxygenase